ncbi:hypothetical protein J6590_024156 [Homalodisca vitripennis]|nr:hypothetical protein J6590_024156 [Homalodisca vitripennis]
MALDIRDATGQGSQGKVMEKKQDWKSGKSQGIRSQVREFRRWSGKNIKSLYTNKLTAAAPSPSLQTTWRMKQAAEAARPVRQTRLPAGIAKNPGDCVEKVREK